MPESCNVVGTKLLETSNDSFAKIVYCIMLKMGQNVKWMSKSKRTDACRLLFRFLKFSWYWNVGIRIRVLVPNPLILCKRLHWLVELSASLLSAPSPRHEAKWTDPRCPRSACVDFARAWISASRHRSSVFVHSQTLSPFAGWRRNCQFDQHLREWTPEIFDLLITDKKLISND